MVAVTLPLAGTEAGELAVRTTANPFVAVIPEMVSVELPLFEIVSVALTLEPTSTLPKSRLPETLMTLVEVAAVGAVVVGDEDLSPLQPKPAAQIVSVKSNPPNRCW